MKPSGTVIPQIVCVGVLLSSTSMPTIAFGEREPLDTIEVALLDSILVNPRAQWRVSGLPPAIRARVHLKATDVPPFPHEDPKLMNPRHWPIVTFVGGERCSLRVETIEYDVVRMVPSFEDVKPGWGYSLFYGRANNVRSRCGPTYSWDADGTLYERAWIEGDDLAPKIQQYFYRPSGELYYYTGRVGGYGTPKRTGSDVEWLEEVFARSGDLVGFGYGASSRTGKDVFLGCWLGQEVDLRGFLDNKHAAIRSIRRQSYPDRSQKR